MSTDPIRRPDESIGETIDRLLAERRPDRFVVAGDPDHDQIDVDDVIRTEWLDEIARDIEAELTAGELRRVLLANIRQQVGQHEGQALRTVNAHLRQYHRSGQWPLFSVTDPVISGYMLNLPLGVVSRYQQPGERVKVLVEHVALRAASSDDLRKFAEEERRRAAKEFTARNDACAGAEGLADELDDAGSASFGDWWRET